VDALDENTERTVGGDEAPVAVDDERWIGLVSAQDLIDRLSHRSQLGCVELPLREGGACSASSTRLRAPERRRYDNHCNRLARAGP